MKPLKIYYPHKPYSITQKWGNPNSMYKDAGFSFTRHNGVDANTTRLDWQGKIVSEYPVFCPVENFTVHTVDFNPKGGGNEIWLVSNEPLIIGDRECHAYIPIAHAKKVLVKAGDKPALGELITIADNTGFSTGVHTHMGLYRTKYNGMRITNYYDVNDANGSFDPALFFTGEYAVDKASLPTLVKSGLRYYNYLLTGS